MNLSAVLTLEESLRAIGQRLETLQARHVELTIEADGIDMRAGAIESENRYWTWRELAEGASGPPDERDDPTHWTDASVLTPAYGGVPTVVLGPGEMALCHQTDEWCSVARIEQAVETYLRIARGWCQA